MKRIVSLILTFAMLVGMLPMTVWAEENSNIANGTCGKNLTWSLDQEGTMTISGTGEMDDYFEYPDDIPWTDYYDEITSVIIEDGVTSIGTYAFYWCTELQDISIPDSVTTMPISVNTKNLDKLVIPAGVTDLDLAFEENFVKFIEVVPENSTYSSDEYGVLFDKDKTVLECYPGGSSITDYTVPDSVRTIGRAAFRGCKNIQRVTLPEGLVELEDLAFCFSGLTEVCFLGDAPEFGYDVFDYLTLDAYYPSNKSGWIESVSQDHGGDVEWLPYSDEPEVPDENKCGENVTWSFEEATGTLTISGTGDMHNRWWPYDAPSDDPDFAPWHDFAVDIKTVVIEEGVTGIGHFAFFDCENLNSISIAESVTFVGCAFVESGLKELYIPAGVTDFRYPTNEGVCKSLTKITVAEGNTVYSSDAYGMLYNKDKTKFIGCPTGYKGTYAIADSVTEIGGWAFTECVGLTEVEIPSSVKTIGMSAFWGCSGLTEVAIPNNVTTIGATAFAECYSLSHITIPASVTSLQQMSFANCTSLEEVRFVGSAPYIDYECFYGTIIKAYYPAGDDTWAEEIEKRHAGTIEWIPYGGESEHNHSYTSVITAPTCTNQGYTTYTCGCGDSYVDNYVDATDHFMGSWTKTKEATCTEDGEERSDCSKCDHYETREVPASGHDYTSKITKPTCAEQGYTTYTCKCGDSYVDDYVDAAGHSFTGGICNICGKEDPDYVIPDDSVIATGVHGDNITWTLDDEGLLIISGTGEMTECEYAKDYSWYEWSTYVRKIYITDGVTSIGTNAFSSYQMADLVSIEIGKDVSSVNLIENGHEAYYVADENEHYSVIDGVLFNKDQTIIVSYPTKKSSSTYEIPAGVAEIGHCAFAFCENLTSITIPDGVTTIGSQAFFECKSLKAIEIPNSVTSLDGVGTFDDCTSLDTVLLSNNIFEIPHNAFSECVSLKNITIPDKVTIVGESAFRGCEVLEFVTFTGDAPSFESESFLDTETTAYYPANNATWTEDVLQDYGGTIKWIAYTTGDNDTGHEHSYTSEVTAPTCTEQGYTTYSCDCGDSYVDDYVDATGHSYTTTVIAPTCTEQGYTQSTCSCGFLYIDNFVDATGHSFGDWYETKKPTLLADGEDRRDCSRCDYYETQVKEKLESISGTCGDGLSWILKDWVLTISGEGSMADYTLSDPPLWQEYNAHIKEVVIENTVTSIGSYAFYRCTGLTEIIIPESICTIGAHAFDGCTNVEKLQFSAASMNNFANENYVFADLGSATDGVVVTIGNTATQIPDYLFCPYVSSAGKAYNGPNVTEVIFEETSVCRRIGAYAFYGCKKLKNILLPDSVAVIGAYAFNGIKIKNSTIRLESIGEGAFYNCEFTGGGGGGTGISISNGTTVIKKESFYGTGLTEVTIPVSVTLIEENAFGDVGALKDVYYGGTKTQWEAIDIRPGNNCLLNARIHYSGIDDEIYAPIAISSFNNHLYALFDLSMTWTEAKEYCESLDGYLVTITSAEEQSAIEELITEGGKHQYWIGATSQTGNWSWVTEESFEYTHWDNNQPDCNGGNEYYALIHNYTSGDWSYPTTRYYWNDAIVDNNYNNDIYNTKSVGFICEYGDIETTNKGTIRYFRKWDPEKLIAYFGEEPPIVEGLDLGSQVTEETDKSFIANVDELVGTYVLVQTKPRDDGMIAADILLSIKPLESIGTGIVTAVSDTDGTVTIDGITYAYTFEFMGIVPEVGDYVRYYLDKGKIVSLEILETTSGQHVLYLSSWDEKSQTVCFGRAVQSMAVVTSRTDTSFQDKLDTLLGKYVLAELNVVDGTTELVSIKAVETKVGTVSEVEITSATIGGTKYTAGVGTLSGVFVGDYVLYHIYEDGIVGVEVLKIQIGELMGWASETRNVSIHLDSESEDGVYSYLLSDVVDDETIEFLNTFSSGETTIVITIQFAHDEQGFVYFIEEPFGNGYRFVVLPDLAELSVVTGQQLEITCYLYHNDEIVTDWEQPAVSFGYLGDKNVITYDGWKKCENGYILTVSGLAIGTATMTLFDDASGATLLGIIDVVSDVGENDTVKKEWIQQHIDYAASDTYKTEIIAGYQGLMYEEFQKLMNDDGIELYDAANALSSLLNLEPGTIDQSDLYELLLAELMYSGLNEEAIAEVYSNHVHEAIVSICKGLYSMLGSYKKANSAVKMKELKDTLAIIESIDLGSENFSAEVKKFTELFEKNAGNYAKKDMLTSTMADIGLSIAYDAVCQATDSFYDVMQYISHAKAYSETSDDFKRVMFALQEKVNKQMNEGSFPALDKREQEINWSELSSALNAFISSLEAYEEKGMVTVAEYASNEIEKGAEALGRDAVKTMFVKSFDMLIGCIPLLNMYKSLKTSLSLGLTAFEILTNIDEQSYRLDMVTKLYCLSVALDGVADEFAGIMGDEYYWTASAFDETIKLYRTTMLKAIDYLAEYEKAVHGSAWHNNTTYDKQQAFVDYIVLLEALSNSKKDIQKIMCHDTDVGNNSSDEVIFLINNAMGYLVACPVDVIVTSNTGEEVAYLSNDSCEVASGYEWYFYTVEIDGGEILKVAIVPDDYNIALYGTDEGTMNVFVAKYNDSKECEVQLFHSIPVEEGSVGSFEANQDESTGKTLIVDGIKQTASTEEYLHTYLRPEFAWDEAFECVATFKCTSGDDVRLVHCIVTHTATPANELEAGKSVYTATVEFEGKTYTDTKIVTIPATGHINHTAGSEWISDGTNHWHKCIGCDEKLDVTNHSGGTATCTKKAVCTICRTSYGELKDHDYRTSWNQGDASGHWHECKNCSAHSTPVKHTPGAAATTTTAQTCTVCGYVITPTLGHTCSAGSKWYSNGTYHWHVCTSCGAWVKTSYHTYSSDTDETCNVCSYTRTVTATETTEERQVTIPETTENTVPVEELFATEADLVTEATEGNEILAGDDVSEDTASSGISGVLITALVIVGLGSLVALFILTISKKRREDK